jgi:hypothetical protein
MYTRKTQVIHVVCMSLDVYLEMCAVNVGVFFFCLNVTGLDLGT